MVLIINGENFLLLNIFLETMIHFFKIFGGIESSKEQHLFEMEMFCNKCIYSQTVYFFLLIECILTE